MSINPGRNISQWVAIARLNGGYLGVTVNIIPFKTIIGYIISFHNNNIFIFLYNIFGRILIFIPLVYYYHSVLKCTTILKILSK